MSDSLMNAYIVTIILFGVFGLCLIVVSLIMALLPPDITTRIRYGQDAGANNRYRPAGRTLKIDRQVYRTCKTETARIAPSANPSVKAAARGWPPKRPTATSGRNT